MLPCGVLCCGWAVAATGLAKCRTLCPHESFVQLCGTPYLKVYNMLAPPLVALLSSVMHSDEVRMLSFRQSILAYDSRSSGHNWRWLFFALFNEAAHHAVTSLSISDTVVELADMETVNELVHSANPMEMLQFWFYEDNPSQSESTATSIAQVVLLNGAQVRLTPEHGPIVLAASSDGTKFDVMYAVDSGYAIFVPGYGPCWVYHEDSLRKRLCVKKTEGTDGI